MWFMKERHETSCSSSGRAHAHAPRARTQTYFVHRNLDRLTEDPLMHIPDSYLKKTRANDATHTTLTSFISVMFIDAQ